MLNVAFRRLTYYLIFLSLLSADGQAFGQEQLFFHQIKTDAQGKIIPWKHDDMAISMDQILASIWNFWHHMKADSSGLPYYMTHQVWNEAYNDHRGIGGDQLQMAMSSWTMYYAYTGDERVKVNMTYMADYYLANSLSTEHSMWPHLPYPYNTDVRRGKYDGDMVIGKGYTQPDKAGSFGFELITLYKMTGDKKYLDAAVNIANTLARHTMPGDSSHSPMPFKVHAITGHVGKLTVSLKDTTGVASSDYTSNWVPTMKLMRSLNQMGVGDLKTYQLAFDRILHWMTKYPLKNNRWGPFFEDVAGWSDTQINAITFARFIMEHQSYFPDWEKDVSSILNWVHTRLGNKTWEKFGVVATNEQTSYEVAANSHTARQGADELLFANLTGNDELKQSALAKLIWATYLVAEDGRNDFGNGEIWLTDGYGDFVRHYLRAMEVCPELVPVNQDHIIHSTSIFQNVVYGDRPNSTIPRNSIQYVTYDPKGMEKIRLKRKPVKVFLNDKRLTENIIGEGYKWTSLLTGGLLQVNRVSGNKVSIFY